MPRDLDELEFLSSAALALGEIGPDDDLFRVVAQQLAPLAPESLVITIAYDPSTGSVAVRALAGPEDMQTLAHEVTGEEPLGLIFPVDEEGRQLLAEGKLVRVEGGMHQLTFRQWPVELARRFEERLGIRSIYGQPFSRKGDFLGAVAFVNRAPLLEHVPVIEVFVRLAAVAIQRQRAEAKLRESERRFRTLAENSRDLIFRLRLSPKLAFEYVSPATLHMCGQTPEALYADARLGAPCMYPASWTTAAELRELPGEPVVARCLRKDGTYFWSEQNFTPTRDASGRIVVVEGISRDITKRKEAEDALVEADRRKTEFLAVLSHELRNPLGAISNSAYLLRLVEPGSERATQAREVIERQLVQLTRLIDDLLDVTRISRGKIHLEPEQVELNELVKVTIEDCHTTFVNAKVEVEVLAAPASVFVHADRARLQQVVCNLLENAAKFTPEGGRASVSVQVDEARRQAVIRVQNTGARIAPELLDHLFEPFVQVDRTLDRRKGGLGLGLALVKGIVELHEGTVDVTSEEPRGTVFTVRLPLDTTLREAPRPESRAEPPEATHRRVLVIEDNADAANSLCAVLRLLENTVALATTGTEGIAMSHAFKPDVVLCDIGLPGMDGYEVARTMRADPDMNGVALVALSGYASPADVEKSRRAGFDRHVSKPTSIEVLERVMSEVARR